MTNEIQKQNPDVQIIGQRTDFIEKIHSHVEQIILEDGVYEEALSGLNQDQKDALYSIIEESAAVYKFGRLSTEQVARRKVRGEKKVVDPLRRGWDRKLQMAGIANLKEREGYINMASSMSHAVTVAYYMDPFIEK